MIRTAARAILICWGSTIRALCRCWRRFVRSWRRGAVMVWSSTRKSPRKVVVGDNGVGAIGHFASQTLRQAANSEGRI